MLNAQTLLAQWTIPTGTFADSLADGGITGNISTKVLKAVGTTVIDFNKTGYAGKAAQATQWDNGNGAKYWQIEVTTTGYTNIKLSSRQQSGNPLTNPGPRDFKLQYKLGTAGTWTDVPSGTIQVLNEWTTSYVNNLLLPTACENVTSMFIRWVMTSNMSDDNTNDVLNTGTSKIDDILVYGDVSAGIQQVSNNSFSIYPNPVVAGNNINLSTEMLVNSVEVFDITGKLVLINDITTIDNNLVIDVRSLKAGMYFLKVNSEGKASSKKIIIY
jgi:hypothetical protein